jgi:hypothetical protein
MTRRTRDQARIHHWLVAVVFVCGMAARKAGRAQFAETPRW